MNIVGQKAVQDVLNQLSSYVTLELPDGSHILLIRTGPLDPSIAHPKRTLGQVFQLFDAENVPINLFKLLEPLKDSLDVSSNPANKELRRGIQRLSDSLREMDQENVLSTIPFIYRLVDIKAQSREEVERRIQQVILQLIELNDIKAPQIFTQKIKVNENFALSGDQVSNTTEWAHRCISFYSKFFQRLNEAVKIAESQLTDQVQMRFLKEKALEFENFSMIVAQITGFKLDVKINRDCVLLNEVLGLFNDERYDEVKIEVLEQIFKLPPVPQQVMQCIFASMYIKFSHFVVQNIVQDILAKFVDLPPDQQVSRDTIVFPNLAHLNAISQKTSMHLIVLQNFEALLQKYLSCIDKAHVYTGSMIQMIFQQFSYYQNIKQTVAQFQELKQFGSLLQESLIRIQQQMCKYELDIFHNSSFEDQVKQIHQFNDQQVVILKQDNYNSQRFIGLFAQSALAFKQIILDIEQSKQIDNPFQQYIKFESIGFFKEQMDKFDDDIISYINQLKPKKDSMSDVLIQFQKVQKLEQLSQTRQNVAQVYIKLSQQLGDQLVDHLELMQKRHRYQSAREYFPFFDKLTQQEQQYLNSYASPLPIFQNTFIGTGTHGQKAILFSQFAMEKIAQLRDMSNNSQRLSNVIKEISNSYCSVSAMAQIVSTCFEKRRKYLYIENYCKIFDFVNGEIISREVPEFQSHLDEFLCLKTLAFSGQTQVQVPKYWNFQVFDRLFQSINSCLIPACQILNKRLQDLSKSGPSLLQSQDIRKILNSLLVPVVTEFAQFPQVFVRDGQIVKAFAQGKSPKATNLIPFYGLFLDDSLQLVQQWEIHMFDQVKIISDKDSEKKDISAISLFLIQLIDRIYKVTMDFESRYIQFSEQLGLIESYLAVFPTCSFAVVKDGIANICFVLSKVCTDSGFDLVQRFVIEQLFGILSRKCILMMDQVYKKMVKKRSTQEEYDSLVVPTINSIQSMHESEVINAEQQSDAFIAELQNQMICSLKLISGQVSFQPSLMQITSNLINVSNKILDQFLNYSFDTQTFSIQLYAQQISTETVKGISSFANLLSVKTNEQSIIQVQSVIHALQVLMRKAAMQSCFECEQFGQLYENKQILFSKGARDMLADMLKEDLQEWVKQFGLFVTNESFESSVQYGFVIIKYDQEFQTQTEQATQQLKQYISKQIQRHMDVILSEISQDQTMIEKNIIPFTDAKIAAIISSTSLNNDIFALLTALDSVQVLHTKFKKQQKLLSAAKDCIRLQQVEIQFQQCEQQDTIQFNWAKNVQQIIESSPDFNNLILQLQQYDDSLSSQSQAEVQKWTEYLNSIQEVKQYRFGDAKEVLMKKSEALKQLQTQIEAIAPSLQTLQTMQLSIQIPKFRCLEAIKALKNIRQDCQFYIEAVCQQLDKCVKEFQHKCDKRIQSFIPDDILQIIKQFQEDSKQISKDILSSCFYKYFEIYLKMIIRISQVVSSLSNSQVFKRTHWKQLATKIAPDISQDEILLSKIIEIFIDKVENDDAVILKQRIRLAEDVLSIANGQFVIEKYLNEVEQLWSETKFHTFSDGRNTLISKWNEYNEQIEEHASGIIGLASSPYYPDYSKRAEEVKNKLNRLTEILDVWADTQRKWVYLQSVFSANSSIVGTYLSNVSEKLNNANESFSQIMLTIIQDPIIINVLDIASFLQTLETIRKNLEEVQKALGSFLEKQRSRSPRLFFVGDDDLLDIISITSKKQIKNMQKHWRKMFTGIERVNIEGEEENVVGLASKQNETIKFTQSDIPPIKLQPNELKMHYLLGYVEQGMKCALKRQAFEILQLIIEATSIETLLKIITNYSAQMIVVAYQILWTNKVDTFIQQDALNQVYDWISQIVIIISTMTLNFDLEASRNILISELTHMKNATDQIIQSIDKKFEWYVQLKFYVLQSNEQQLEKITQLNFQASTFSIMSRMGDASLDYLFEYQGTDQRIVQTNLTDFCYLIATQAITDKLGCAPQGRAGTGKTESVKALAIQLGRPVLVFNTDENFNEAAVGRILIGACEVGSMVCFDEFNRLEENTLSAVSQQLNLIQQGLKENQPQIPNFLSNSEKSNIVLSQHTAIFVTMNPGYAGRRELPDTLKALLRDVAMNKPDLYSITEVILSSNGFINSLAQSKKIVPFFTLASEQMSEQPHYDWGLRAIKAVLNSAGTILKELLAVSTIVTNDKDAIELQRKNIENQAIIGAIIDAVVPKLIQIDINVFNCLLLDIFPGANLKPVEDIMFKQHVLNVIAEKNLVKTDLFVTKIMQIFRCQQVNIGLMLVGSTGTSKSEALRVFIEAFDRYQNSKLCEQHPSSTYKKMMRFDILCPKSFTGKEDLFGSLDQTTREWQDGQFTTLLREYLTEIAEYDPNMNVKKQYIACFDSYIDPEWVESLNSVLDDNRCLTLPNGERLSIPSNVHLVFEVKDLKNATPATVSRCSMIWFAQEILPTQIRFEGYVQKIEKMGTIASSKQKISLKTLLFSAIYKTSALAWRIISNQIDQQDNWKFMQDILIILKKSKVLQNEIMIFSEARLLTTIFSLLDASVRECQKIIEQSFVQIAQKMPQFMQVDADSDYVQIYDKQIELLNQVDLNQQKLLIFMKRRLMLAIQWGFCCPYNNKSRFDISKLIFEYFSPKLKKEVFEGLDAKYDDELINSNTILQYNLSPLQEQWQHNSVKIQKSIINENQVGSCVIQTLDTITYGFLIESWLKSNYPLILVGPAGSGKSMSLISALKNLSNFEMVFVSFSSNTTPEYVKKLIMRNCEKVHTSQGIVLQPKIAEQTLVIMCDEINLPAPDAFQCQRTVEFIRSAIENQAFYDPLTKTTYQLQRVAFAGTCNPPTDPGRYHMCERFLSHCPVFLCDFPTYDSLNLIYTTFIQAVLSARCPNLNDKAQLFAKAMVDVYTKVSTNLTTEQQQHYIYSPRELTRWSRGLMTGLNPENQYSMVDVAKLVYHEGLRLFLDRLVENHEKVWLIQEINKIMIDVLTISEQQIKNQDGSPILFSFLNQLQKYELTTLQDIRPLIEVREKSYFDDVSIENPLSQRIILFDEVVETILKIDRVIKQPVGHLLIVGVSGVGKTLISKFTAWLNNYEIYEISTHKKYTLQDFEELLRKLIIRSGVKDVKLAFLFDESNALETTFLEHMNALLASGEVPGLFEGDQMMQLLNQAREQIEKLRADDVVKLPKQNAKDDEILNWVTKRVQNNLHIIFSMNPPAKTKSQSGMQSTAASSPALFNRCVIVWMGDWNTGSFLQVCCGLLQEIDFSGENKDEQQSLSIQHLVRSLSNPSIKDSDILQLLTENAGNQSINQRIQKSFVLMHKEAQKLIKMVEEQRPSSIPPQFVDGASVKLSTPRHFMRTISCLKQTWNKALYQQRESFSHVSKGLSVLKETQQEVQKMQDELSIKTIQLNDARKVADEKLAEMVVKKSEAQTKSVIANDLVASILKKQTDIAEKKGPIQLELAEAQPAVERAKKAISNIDKHKLDELRGFAKPSDVIGSAMSAVLLIVGDETEKQNLTWDNVKRAMRRPEFLKNMMEYDPDKQLLPVSTMKKLKTEYLDKPNLTYDIVNRASTAAGPMYLWATSVCRYQEIAKKIEPLTNEIAAMEAEEIVLKQKHVIAEKEISELRVLIDQYESEYRVMLKRQSELDAEKQKTELKLHRASGLINSLQAEGERWQKQCAEFDQKLKNSAGDQLLLSFYQVYSLVLPENLRKQLIQKLFYVLDQLQITYSENMIMDEVIFNDPGEKTRWINSCGLSNDGITLENMSSMLSLSFQDGGIYKFFMPSPGLLINVGNTSSFKVILQKIFGKSALFASTVAQDLQQNVERALRFGQTLIVENVEDYDPLLNECIDFASDVGGHVGYLSNRKIEIAGRELEANPNFRLILMMNSAGSAKALPPSVLSKCQMLNFAITQTSYASNIQQQILEYERPSVGKERQKLMADERTFSARLVDLEKQLLNTISQTDSKQILESDTVGLVLQKTKSEAAEVQSKREQSQVLCQNLEQASELYGKIAYFASSIYFSLQKLPKIKFNAYFSMNLFQFIFEKCLKQICIVENEIANQPDETTKRMSLLAKYLIKQVYTIVGCALPEVERQAYAMHIISLIHSDEVCTTIMGFDAANFGLMEKDIMFKGLDVALQKSFQTIQENFELIQQNKDAFSNVRPSFIQLLEYWKGEKITKPQEQQITQDNALNTLILGATLEPLAIPEVLPEIFNLLVVENSFNCPINMQFSELVSEFKSSRQPFLITVVGPTDPNSIALQCQQNKQLIQFAVGQKDCNITNIKQKLLSVKKETLLIISNIHLAPNKFSEMLLKLLLDSLQQNQFLTAVLTASLSNMVPTSIYASCIKFSVETPLNLAVQCRKTFQDIMELSKSYKSKQLDRLCLLSALLHSIITLRSKFTPNGYIQDYNYTYADIEAQFRILTTKLGEKLKQSFIKEEEIPFYAIKEYIQRICYGNKVVFTQDRIIMNKFVDIIMSLPTYQSENLTILDLQLPQPQSSTEDMFKKLDAISDDIIHIGLQPIAKKIYFTSQLRRTLSEMATLESQDDIKVNENDDNSLLIKLIQQWLTESLAFEAAPVLNFDDCWYSNVKSSLREEINISNNVIEVIIRDLQALLKYLKKETIRTNRTFSIMNQLSVGSVPTEWKEFLFSKIDKVTEFIKNVKDRRLYIFKAISELNAEHLFSNDNLELGKLYQPTSMLTSLKQVFARKLKCALDDVQTIYTLKKYPGITINITDVKLMFGSYQKGQVVVQNALTTQIGVVYACYSIEKMDTNGVSLPVYVDQTRKAEVFRFVAQCKNEDEVVINAVAGILSE